MLLELWKQYKLCTPIVHDGSQLVSFSLVFVCSLTYEMEYADLACVFVLL
jgi:hypothetical protein